MRVGRRASLPLATMVVAVAAAGHAQSAGLAAPDPAAPPAPVSRPRDPRYAVALEAGRLVDGTQASSRDRGAIAAGDVLLYYGEEIDEFGRSWHAVGDPSAWMRRDEWFAFPAEREHPATIVGRLSLLTGWQAPVPLAARLAQGTDARTAILESQQPIRVAPDWWRQTIDIEGAYVPEVGELVAMPIFRVSADVAADAIGLVGGLESLAPWPSDPGIGRLHIAPLLPLVFRYSGEAWTLDEVPLIAAPVIGLLGNPLLALDLQGPTEATGPLLTCWKLAGAYDPRGTVVGRLETAPAAPVRLAAASRPGGNQWLGLVDRSAILWPVATPALTAPRKVEPPTQATGVVVADESRRQAVYVEQVLPPRVARELRGRELRLSAWARAMPEGDTAVSTTVSIEIEAGSVRVARSASVGALSTRLDVLATVPEDAESIVVRLLPVDRSVSVTEGGRSIFDRASLAPTMWPATTQPAALYLYRIRAASYAPARRYTRALVAVSERSPAELSRAWSAMRDSPDRAAVAAILAGKLEPEMNETDVEIAWGEPLRREAAGSLQRWEWPDRSASFAADGRLIAWQRDAASGLPRLPVCPAVEGFR